MFIAGYVYTTNPSRPGFRPAPPFSTAKAAEKWICDKLAGKGVRFDVSTDNEGTRFRAIADGQPTAYIYFEVQHETWALIDLQLLGVKGKAAVKGSGSLSEMKNKARTIVEKDLKDRGRTLSGVNFGKTGDNIEVKYRTTTDAIEFNSELFIVRL